MLTNVFNYLEKLSAEKSQPQHNEFLDEHFSLSPQWKEFKKKLKNKTFVEAVKQDTRADDKLKRFSVANGKHIQAKGVPSFKVTVNKKEHTVKYHPEEERFSCNCGDWFYRRSWQERRPNKDCKHIIQIKTELKKGGKSEVDLVKKAAFSRAIANLRTGFLSRI